MVALSERRRLAEVFEYRFEGGVELRDHSVGNIIIAALADMSGGFCEGVQQAARFLRIKGSVQPAATESLTLVFHHADGSVTHGESTVGFGGSGSSPKARSRRPRSSRPSTGPTPSCSARGACTSTIPALLGAGVSGALAEFGGPVIYAANIMTQPGETVGCTLSDHLVAIAEHVGPVVTDVPVHQERLPAPLVSRYRAEGAAPVEVDRGAIERLGVRVRTAPLLPDEIGSEARRSSSRFGQDSGTTPSGLRVPCSTWRLPERRRCVRLPEGSAAAVTGPASAWRGGPSGPPP